MRRSPSFVSITRKIYELFMQGVEGLRYFLPRWDYRNKWSLYSNGAYLCPPGYHCLNRMLLIVLTRLTGDSYFAEYSEAWNPARLSLLGRAEIYLEFLLTKNACRLKNRPSRHRQRSISQFENGTLVEPLPITPENRAQKLLT